MSEDSEQKTIKLFASVISEVILQLADKISELDKAYKDLEEYKR